MGGNCLPNFRFLHCYGDQYHEESPGGQTYKSMEQKRESRNELYQLRFDKCEKHLSGEDLLSTWPAATTLKKQTNKCYHKYHTQPKTV